MKHITCCSLCLLLLLSFIKAGDPLCGIRNTSFQQGEVLTFKVFYTLAGFYMGVGEARFTANLERVNNKPLYHIKGEGKTSNFYDGFFKVRDRYETYLDTSTLQPTHFIRNISEGGYQKFEDVTFNHVSQKAITTDGEFKIPACIQDVVSSIYSIRNIDFSKYRTDDKIPFSMFLGNEVYNLFVRYQGKEKIKTKYGRFSAIKLKPLLVKGDVFKGGEQMTVWISDDANHIPLRIESAISVGKVKIDMVSYQNLRYPLSSLSGVN